MAIVTIQDTGVGISGDDLPHVFDRFFRVDRSRTRAYVGSGAGLGLAIVKYIVESHNGKVAVNSTLGVGTTFTIEIPMPDKMSFLMTMIRNGAPMRVLTLSDEVVPLVYSLQNQGAIC
jgi:signal transduction histidine kinase